MTNVHEGWYDLIIWDTFRCITGNWILKPAQKVAWTHYDGCNLTSEQESSPEGLKDDRKYSNAIVCYSI